MKTEFKSLIKGLADLSPRNTVAFVLIGAFFVSAGFLGWVSLAQQRSALENEMHRRAESTLNYLGRHARRNLKKGDSRAYADYLSRLRRRTDVVSAAVYDAEGKLFATYQSGRVEAAAFPLKHAVVAPETVVFNRLSHGDEGLLEATGSISGDDPGTMVGTIKVVFSERRLEAALWRQKKILLMVTAAFLLIGLALAITGSDFLTRGVRAKLKEKKHMERYLSQSTLQLIKRMRNADRLKLGGERKHVAVLFADIRGFTQISEKLSAEEVVSTLNVYLHTQAEVIYKRGGVVDKFIGDEIMAIFSEDDAEYRAALSAQEIVNYIDSLNETRRSAGKELMTVGVGLNAGSVIMGNMGSERQMDYTAMGDPINVAARLCALAQPGQVVMSWPLLSAIAGRCRWGMLPFMPVKGKTLPIEVYELRDIPGAARRHMRRQLDEKATVILESSERHPAVMRDVSCGGCAIELPFPIKKGAFVDVRFPASLIPEGGAQAVVQNFRKRDGYYRTGLRFTNLSDKDSHTITDWVHAIDIEMVSSSEKS